MRKILGVLSSLIFLTGCETLHLATGPDVHALVNHPNAMTVAVAKAIDERGTVSAGSIGGTGVRVKDDLSALVSNYLLNYLNVRMGTNVVPVPITPEDKIRSVLQEHRANRMVIAKIKKLRMFSLDALLQPVEVDGDFEVAIFDESGKEKYRGTANGHYQKRIGLAVGNKSISQLVEFTVRDAMNNLVKDPAFHEALKAA